MGWLLRLLVSDADRRTIDSDLAELFELRRRQRGERAARRWLRRQRVLYPLHLMLEALRAAIYDRITTMNHLWRDIRYSIRSLARTPAVAVTIMLTVGIALGATAAMVGIVRAVLVDPLPYADPGSLVWIYTDAPPFRFRFSVVDYRALEQDHPTFSSVAAISDHPRDDQRHGRRRTRHGEGCHRFLLSASRAAASAWATVRPVRRCARGAPGGVDIRVLGAPIRRGPDGRRTNDHDRRRELRDRRGAAEERGAARARRGTVHGGALAAAQTEGAVLHDGACPRQAGGLARRGGRGAPCHQRTTLPHLAILLPGRKGDLGSAGPRRAHRRRRAERR